MMALGARIRLVKGLRRIEGVAAKKADVDAYTSA
jgi:hypothetical protein